MGHFKYRREDSSWIYDQAKTFKVSIKGKTRNIVEQVSDYYIRDGIAKGKSSILGEFLKDFLSSNPYRVFVSDDKETYLYYLQESYRNTITCPVSEEGDSFTYDIPGGIEYVLLSRQYSSSTPAFSKLTSPG